MQQSTLHHYLSIDLPYNRKVMRACGLSESHLPCRRTFDRRLKTISTDIKERISTMGNLFVTKELVDPSITAIDSALLKAKGHVWHKSSMKKGIVPCPGIDTDARWGYSHTKGWIFGYKLHLTSSTATTTAAAAGGGKEIIVPLNADVTTAMFQTIKCTFL